jgi:hypothetical protein
LDAQVMGVECDKQCEERKGAVGHAGHTVFCIDRNAAMEERVADSWLSWLK